MSRSDQGDCRLLRRGVDRSHLADAHVDTELQNYIGISIL